MRSLWTNTLRPELAELQYPYIGPLLFNLHKQMCTRVLHETYVLHV